MTEIRSAMNEAMSDGGTIVQKVLNNEVSGKQLDYGEATLGKVYCDFVRGERDLAESSGKTEENPTTLAATAQAVAALRVTLPTEVLDANRAVRPDRMQALYDYLNEQSDLSRCIPLPPFAQGSNDRMEEIIKVVQEKLAGVANDSYTYYKQLSAKWVYGMALGEIVRRHVGFLRSRAPCAIAYQR